jgi:hypothetical protein
MFAKSKRPLSKAVKTAARSMLESLEERKLFAATLVVDAQASAVEGNYTGGTGIMVTADPGSTAQNLGFSWEIEFDGASPADFDSPTSGHVDLGFSSTPMTGYASVLFAGDRDCEPDENFKWKITPDDPQANVSNGNPQSTIVDDDYTVTQEAVGPEIGTIFDPDGILVEVTVKDYDGSPVANQQVDFSVPPQVTGINFDTPYGTVTGSDGKMQIRLTSGSNWEFSLRTEVSGWSQPAYKNWFFEEPYIDWDGGTADTLSLFGWEMVGGTVYKRDMVTPFPDLQVYFDNDNGNEPVFPEYQSAATDNQGRFQQYLTMESPEGWSGDLIAHIDYTDRDGNPAVVEDLKTFTATWPHILGMPVGPANIDIQEGTVQQMKWTVFGESGRPVYNMYLYSQSASDSIATGVFSTSSFTNADGEITYYLHGISPGIVGIDIIGGINHVYKHFAVWVYQ